ncbi:unnamed protein product [Ilex paraguariensis]
MKCKKHPNHQQSPGVCSMCLREKLSRLPGTSTTTTYAVAAASSSSLSSLSSSNSYSYTSPVHRNGRVDLEAKGSVNFLKSGKNLLAKSRSMAFVPRRREVETIMDHGKKKKGFWSKLIRPGKKRMDKGLRNSRTMIERVSTRVH